MTPKTLRKPEKKVAENRSPKNCVHYWLIEPPLGPISKGICKICGAEKDFLNYVP